MTKKPETITELVEVVFAMIKELGDVPTREERETITKICVDVAKATIEAVVPKSVVGAGVPGQEAGRFPAWHLIHLMKERAQKWLGEKPSDSSK